MTGIGELRRAMRALPDAAKAEIGDELRSGGFDIVSAMRAKAPRKTGQLERAISYRVLAKGLVLRAGLLDDKGGASTTFYGRIQDLGRKEQVVRVRRRKPGGGMAKSYTMQVRYMAGKRFVTGQYATLKARIGRNLQAVGARIARRLGLG